MNAVEMCGHQFDRRDCAFANRDAPCGFRTASLRTFFTFNALWQGLCKPGCMLASNEPCAGKTAYIPASGRFGGNPAGGGSLFRLYDFSAAQPQRSADQYDRDRNRPIRCSCPDSGTIFNALALTMRDMLDEQEPYPLTAWAPQFRRIRSTSKTRSREREILLAERTSAILPTSSASFGDALDRTLIWPAAATMPRRGSASGSLSAIATAGLSAAVAKPAGAKQRE